MSCRMTQNMNIEMKNVFVPENNKLGKCTDFADGPSKILMHSRLLIAWIAVGLAAGSYETALAYTKKRIAFKKPVAQFQLVQQNLMTSLSKIMSMLTLLKHISELYDKGEATFGMRALAKAHTSKESREVVALCREVLAGNGILSENKIMRHMLDLEVMHTGEGTYQVNTLVAGREFTGLKAFK